MKRNEPKHKQVLAFTNKKTAHSAPVERNGESGHVLKDYDVLKDETIEGIRTIVLKEQDQTEIDRKRKEFVNIVAQKLGDESSLFKKLLHDAIKDYWNETIERLYKRVTSGDKVSSREGCFKIYIGDGRTKRGESIQLLG